MKWEFGGTRVHARVERRKEGGEVKELVFIHSRHMIPVEEFSRMAESFLQAEAAEWDLPTDEELQREEMREDRI